MWVYLSNKVEPFLLLNNAPSRPVQLGCDVPQGLFLGPILKLHRGRYI